MNQISKSEARDKGLKHYFTGKPCKRGHVAKRLVSTSHCTECARIALQEWTRANLDRSRAQKRQSAKAKYHKDVAAARDKSRKWYNENAEQARMLARKWYHENKDSCSERHKLWRVKNQHRRTASQSERKARFVSATPNWSEKTLIESWYALARVMTEIMGERYEVDHVVPLKGKNVCGLHTQDNLQILTQSQNASKGNRWPA